MRLGGSNNTALSHLPLSLSLPSYEIDRLLFKSIGIKGWYLGQYLGELKDQLPARMGELLSAMGKGSLSCACKEYDFATQWKDAFDSMTKPGSVKPVLVSKF